MAAPAAGRAWRGDRILSLRRAPDRDRRRRRRHDREFFDPKDAESVEAIKELIETRVRPAVARDGGDIIFKGYPRRNRLPQDEGRLLRLPLLDGDAEARNREPAQALPAGHSGRGAVRGLTPGGLFKAGGWSIVGSSRSSGSPSSQSGSRWRGAARRSPSARAPLRGCRTTFHCLSPSISSRRPRADLSARRALRPARLWPVRLGAALTFAGVAFAIWARLWIAGNWSSDVTLKRDHELIVTGPYAWVATHLYRHSARPHRNGACGRRVARRAGGCPRGRRVLAQAHDRGGRYAAAIRRDLRALCAAHAGADPVVV